MTNKKRQINSSPETSEPGASKKGEVTGNPNSMIVSPNPTEMVIQSAKKQNELSMKSSEEITEIGEALLANPISSFSVCLNKN